MLPRNTRSIRLSFRRKKKQLYEFVYTYVFANETRTICREIRWKEQIERIFKRAIYFIISFFYIEHATDEIKSNHQDAKVAQRFARTFNNNLEKKKKLRGFFHSSKKKKNYVALLPVWLVKNSTNCIFRRYQSNAFEVNVFFLYLREIRQFPCKYVLFTAGRLEKRLNALF